MATEFPHKKPLTVDLTGLPEKVVHRVLQLVQDARDSQAHAEPDFPLFVSRADTQPEELEKGLAAMAAMGTGQTLPLDWSRDDLYDDHD
ncbi:MAG: hypothetical protein K2X87_19930 [Gemmataceae bacterium]|nr:hypothetical protein [Gemmataceae bacterium]